MNRRILYTSVLSVVLAMALSVLLDMIFPPAQTESTPLTNETLTEITQITSSPAEIGTALVAVATSEEAEEISFETEFLEGTFSTLGASLKSLSFKNFKSENQERIELIDVNSVGLFGESWTILGQTLPEALNYRLLSSEDNLFTFEAKLNVAGRPVTLLRTYSVGQEDYLFRVEDKVLGVGADEIKTQISFKENLPAYGVTDPTTAHAYTTKFVNVKKAQNFEARWAGAVNRYLAMALIPTSSRDMTWTEEEGHFQASWAMDFERAEDNVNVSSFYVYLGPKDGKELSRYDISTQNNFGLENLYLDSLIQQGWLSWVQNLLAWVLGFFFAVFPNWGVAIILLTIMVKVLLYPAALRAHKSTASMQKVQPQIKALQEKYKENPTRMQQEMQKIYQKHGVNPLGGCLPVLVQIPIFIALYGLLNNYLALRGAIFIPGWIMDLSLPESILHFNFTLPFLGWQDIRLLPIIMLATQFASGWINMNNAQTAAMSGSQQKLLFYGMPTVFFFVLYDMASGLLIYWIVNNILTVAQQFYLTRYRSN